MHGSKWGRAAARVAVLLVVLNVIFAGATGCSGSGGTTAGARDLAQSLPGIATYVVRTQLPPCTPGSVGSVYYVSSTNAFYYCSGTTLVEIQVVGQPGVDGKTWRVTLADAGVADCSQGGTLIRVGPDGDGNGVLDQTEITGSSKVCNGHDGRTALIRQTPEAAGPNCTHGGARIDSGLDVDGNGVLDSTEATSTSYVCHGASPGRVTTARFHDEVCDETAQPDVGNAVFVDATLGDDTFGDGTPESPTKTLSEGVALAIALGRNTLYLAEGTYDAPLTLPAGSGLYVEGGWQRGSQASWHRHCSPTPRASTTLAGGVVARGATGGLRSLTVTKNGGSSNIAVHVANGKLFLREVDVTAGPGQDAALAADGAAGAPGLGATSACSTGAEGLTAPDGSPSAGWTFDEDATFHAGDGLGSVGTSTAGANGQAAAPTACPGGYCSLQTQTTQYQCGQTQCGTTSCNPHDCHCTFFGGCDTCYDSCPVYCPAYCPSYSYSCSFQSGTTSLIPSGCGTGGSPGMPGAPGGGGGASIALAIGNGASVTVVKSALSAGRGGAGAPGGVGGPGGLGSAGAATTSQCSTGGCGAPTGCQTLLQPVSSRPGGNGGAGGDGPRGGAGAGGPSYAIVKVGTAVTLVSTDSTLGFDTGGIGAPGAPDGTSGLTLTLP